MRKILKRGSFTSVTDLQRQILAFMDYDNQMVAKPFTWTSQGPVLTDLIVDLFRPRLVGIVSGLEISDRRAGRPSVPAKPDSTISTC